jgi:hypothetical protein
MDDMFLSDVEKHQGDDNYSTAVQAMKRAGLEYPQILHMFSFSLSKSARRSIWSDSRRRLCAKRRPFHRASGN